MKKIKVNACTDRNVPESLYSFVELFKYEIRQGLERAYSKWLTAAGAKTTYFLVVVVTFEKLAGDFCLCLFLSSYGVRSPDWFSGWPSAVGLWTGHFMFEGGGGGGILKRDLLNVFCPSFFS